MKKLVLTTLAIAGLYLLPLPADARLGEHISNLKKDRLLKEFNIEQHIKGPVSQVRIYELNPAPKNMKDNILIKLQFDGGEKLIAAEMWISNVYRKEDAVFAKFFAGRFLNSMLAVSDTAQLASLMDELKYREEAKNVRLVGEVPKLPKQPSAAYQALIAQSKNYDQAFKRSKYSVAEVQQDGKVWTKIRVEPK